MQKFCKLSLLQCTVARDITSHWTIKSFPLNCWDIGTADLPDPLRQEFFTHKFYSETTDEKKRGRIGIGTCVNELESETCMKGNGDGFWWKSWPKPLQFSFSEGSLTMGFPPRKQ